MPSRAARSPQSAGSEVEGRIPGSPLRISRCLGLGRLSTRALGFTCSGAPPPPAPPPPPPRSLPYSAIWPAPLTCWHMAAFAEASTAAHALRRGGGDPRSGVGVAPRGTGEPRGT